MFPLANRYVARIIRKLEARERLKLCVREIVSNFMLDLAYTGKREVGKVFLENFVGNGRLMVAFFLGPQRLVFGVRERCTEDGDMGVNGMGWRVGLYQMAFAGLEPSKEELHTVDRRWDASGGKWVPCQRMLDEI